MENTNNIVKLAVDLYHGTVEKYSKTQAEEVLRQALIEANGGKDYIDMHDLGRSNEMFRLVEQILAITIPEGLTGNEFFMNFVEMRNVALGDSNVFVIENNDVFEVAEIADGTQALRRQRIGGSREYTLATKTYGIRIYEEMNRVLAKRSDFNTLIRKLQEAVTKFLWDQIFAAWSGMSSDDFGGTDYFPAAGAYDEDTLLDIIAHVEARTEQKATIIGTKKALRNITLDTTYIGNEVKADYYNKGYIGSFLGTPVMEIPQRHKVGSTEWLMKDDELVIIAGSPKPIKVVIEGNPLIISRPATDQMDLTVEYCYIDKYGVAVVADGEAGIGKYQIV